MRERTKRLWFLIATLPGVAIPFLPFVLDVGPKLGYAELASLPGLSVADIAEYLYVLSLLAAFAPAVLVLVDLWRLVERPATRALSGMLAAFGLLTGVSFVAVFWLTCPIFMCAAEPDLPLAAEITGAALLIGGLVAYACSRRVPTVDAASIGLMGAFVLIVMFHAVAYGDYDPGNLNSGGYIGLYICGIFLTRIVDVLRVGKATKA